MFSQEINSCTKDCFLVSNFGKMFANYGVKLLAVVFRYGCMIEEQELGFHFPIFCFTDSFSLPDLEMSIVDISSLVLPSDFTACRSMSPQSLED